jgi:ABC-type transport system involved in multi-copper enzyme maturation permease subunit
MRLVLNPVLGREVRQRLRSGRSFAIVATYLLLLALVTWFVHQASVTSSAGNPWGGISQQTSVGRRLFEWTIVGQLGLLGLFLPALAAGSIAGERERQTLVPLQVTLLTPRQIIWGKVTSSTAFVALLLVVALPVFAVANLLGGVGVVETVRGALAVAAMGALLATVCVAASALVRRVQGAVLLGYLMTLLLFAGAPVALAFADVVDERQGVDPADAPRWLLLPNPLVGVAEATGSYVDSDFGDSGPLGSIREASRRTPSLQQGNDFFVFESRYQGAYGGVANWVWSYGALAVVATALFLLAARRIRAPSEVER